jgi:formylglycine-generating enzyme required for sulfatase activity
MHRLLRLSLGWGLLVGAAAALCGLPQTAPGRAADASADFKPYTEKVPGTSLTFDMVPIPAGTFMMGSPPTEANRSPDEGPQFKVQLPAFWMARVETTWDLYDLYWKDENIPEGDKRRDEPVVTKDALTRPTPPYADETFGHAREGHPVLGITHHAALMYCQWLSRKTGKDYRLPTEAEWEYACRAGTTTAYPFGDDPARLDEYAWYAKNANDTTHPIGSKKPNGWGLYDLMGNVAEWCMDHYAPDDYKKYAANPLTIRPLRKPTSFKYSYVARGGSWADDPPRCRSAARRGSDKSWLKRDPQRPQSIWWMTDADFVGFRVVRPVEEMPELKGFLPPVDWKSRDNDDK